MDDLYLFLLDGALTIGSFILTDIRREEIMWNLPLSTLLAFITLIITILASIIWALFSAKNDQNDTTDENQ
jgi:ABC-type dipeptide/oligopeptide/nickel transport system permease component